MTIIRYMVPEIWSATDRIFFAILGHFLPFYPTNSPKKENIKKMKKNARKYHFTPSVPNIMITGYPVPEIWLVTDVIIFHFELYFSLLPRNKNFKKNEANTRDCLKKYTKNHDMFYCSWGMACDRCDSYFSFWAIFALLPPQQPKKWKFHKNEKNTWRYHHFTQVLQKSWYAILFLRYDVWQM